MMYEGGPLIEEGTEPHVPDEKFEQLDALAWERLRSRCLQKGDDAWALGDTHTAAKYYEDALLPKQEFEQKANALREAIVLVHNWEDECSKLKQYVQICADIAYSDTWWCDKPDCVRCRSREALTKAVSEEIYSLLSWKGLDFDPRVVHSIDSEAPLEGVSAVRDYAVIWDREAERVLLGNKKHEDGPTFPATNFYRAAADAFERTGSRTLMSFPRPAIAAEETQGGIGGRGDDPGKIGTRETGLRSPTHTDEDDPSTKF